MSRLHCAPTECSLILLEWISELRPLGIKKKEKIKNRSVVEAQVVPFLPVSRLESMQEFLMVNLSHSPTMSHNSSWLMRHGIYIYISFLHEKNTIYIPDRVVSGGLLDLPSAL